jgi:hypothetical protein
VYVGNKAVVPFSGSGGFFINGPLAIRGQVRMKGEYKKGKVKKEK